MCAHVCSRCTSEVGRIKYLSFVKCMYAVKSVSAVLILTDRYCCSGEQLTANSTLVKQSETEPLEQLDITKYLVFRKPDEEGPDVRGGHPDALIIHATKANKNGELQCLDIAVLQESVHYVPNSEMYFSSFYAYGTEEENETGMNLTAQFI